jgi:hypothetical protein
MAVLNQIQQLQQIKPHHRHNSFAKYYNSPLCNMQQQKILGHHHLIREEIVTDLHLRLCQKMHLQTVVL